MLKNLPANAQSPGQEDPLELEIAPFILHYCCLEDPMDRGAWKSPWTKELGRFHGQRSLVGCGPWGHKELDMTKRLNTHTHIADIHC